MRLKKIIIPIILIIFAAALVNNSFSQEKQTVLTPENANEAQMTAAGYKLDRIETFLEKNNMYIYIFKVDSDK
ncbi:MAG: hypothetical protein JW755_10800 [Candidatus Aminicenantes bacterium]|nr:hypothetical protein [Candidatus Aminicenantes bacterium]